MTFAQGMFTANYVVLILSERTAIVVIAFVLMLTWGAIAVLELRGQRESC